MISAKFIQNEEELEEHTGWSHERLIEEGFDLDDWDWAIAVPPFAEKDFEEKQWLILSAMENYCCGYQKYQTLLWTYYLVYHS